MFSRLQYISQGKTEKEQYHHICEALDAGCDWVQLRYKSALEPELYALAGKVKLRCANYGATLIINDHPQLAVQVGADGVHLGLDDMSIEQAKQIAADKIIGGTANTIDHVLQRVGEGCHYVGLGPFRFTTTKEKLSPVLGLQGFQSVMDELSRRNISIPVFAIGGIVAEDIEAILDTGVYGVALSGVITHHQHKEILLQQINTSLYGAAQYRR